jgi:hypothetical protein
MKSIQKEKLLKEIKNKIYSDIKTPLYIEAGL